MSGTATTQAQVDKGASVTTETGGTACGNVSGTDICVTATSANDARAFSDDATGGLPSIGVAIPSAVVDAGTEAYYDGTVGSAAGVTLSAQSANDADSTSAVVTAGLGAGDGSVADA